MSGFPANINYIPLKYICRCNAVTLAEDAAEDFEIDYVDISSVDDLGAISKPQTMIFRNAPSRARRIVRDGDVLISTVRTYLKAIAHVPRAPENLICSTGFAVLSPQPEIVPRFLFYWVSSDAFVSEIVSRSVGVSYPAINPSELMKLPFPLRTTSSQAAIVEFLDGELGLIDELIAKKKTLIKLLEEQKAAEISRAVTVGLNPGTARKPSDFDWLGSIPLHWNVVPLKFLAEVQSGVTVGKKHDVSEILESRPYLRVANVQNGYLDLEDIATIEISGRDTAQYELRPGDVVVTEGGDFDKLARGYVWNGEIAGCLHQNHIFAVRPNQKKLRPTFLAALMTSLYGRNYFTATSVQSTNLACTNRFKLRGFPVPLPMLEEQDTICQTLDVSSIRFQKLTQQLRSTIERLREFRSALITAAVTGQLNLREHEKKMEALV